MKLLHTLTKLVINTRLRTAEQRKLDNIFMLKR